MGKILPIYEDLLRFYPTDPDPEKVKRDIGGSVNKSWYENTCIIRVSRALNYTNNPIPADSAAFKTRQGSDGKWYGLGVQQFWEYLEKHYGKPTIYAEKPNAGSRIPVEKFQRTRGIIGFRVKGWKGASGHFTLWDGFNLIYAPQHDYFSISSKAALWTAGTSKVSLPPT